MNFLKVIGAWFGLSQMICANVYVATGSSGWNSEWWINEQPAFVGHGAYGVNVSRFIVDGNNKVVFKLAPIVGAVSSKPTSKLVVAKSLFDKGDEVWRYSEHDATKGELSFNFNFDVDRQNRWVWESADNLKVVIDHKETLFKMIKSLKKAVKNKKNADFLKLSIGSWKLDQGQADEKIMEDRLSLLKSIDKTTIKEVDESSYKLKSGSKVVMVYSNDGSLLKGKSKLDGMEINFVIDYIYFYKQKGKWIMLFP